MRNINAVSFSVVVDRYLGFSKACSVVFVVPFEVLVKRNFKLRFISAVILHKFDNFFDHFLLYPDVPLVTGYFLVMVDTAASGKVRIQPYFDLSVSVNADQIFPRLEVPDEAIQLLEAIKGTGQDIQMLRMRNVLNVAQSERNVFDKDQCIVTGIAELVVILGVDVLSINYAFLALPPGEEFEVFLVHFGIVKVQHVLFDLLIGEIVGVEAVGAILGAELAVGIDEVPVLVLEGGQFKWARLFVTHLTIKIISPTLTTLLSPLVFFHLFLNNLKLIITFPSATCLSQLNNCNDYPYHFTS